VRARSLALAAAAALSLGCHTVRYDAGRPPSPRRYQRTVHFFAWGLAGKPVIDLDAACPEGVAGVHSGATFPQWLGQVVTLGLWSPRRVTVTCAEVAR
jgi:Bor protein